MAELTIQAFQVVSDVDDTADTVNFEYVTEMAGMILGALILEATSA